MIRFYIKYAAVLLFLSFFSLGENSQAAVVSDERIVDWKNKVGAEGDIPGRTTICSTIDSNAYGNGETDATAAIQMAINNCPINQVIYLPAGIYKVSNSISINKSISLRGEGTDRTIIKGDASFVNPLSSKIISFSPTGYSADLFTDHPEWAPNGTFGHISLSSGLEKGSTEIITATPHQWQEGDLIHIDQLEDPTGDPQIDHIGSSGACTWCSRSSGTRPIGQTVKIISVPNNMRAILEVPLYWSYDPTKNPEATKVGNNSWGLVTNAGIENLKIDNSVSGVKDIISLTNTSNCWLYNVDLYGGYHAHISMWQTYRTTIRGCSWHHGIPVIATTENGDPTFGPNRGYGLLMNPRSSADLIEDNIIYNTSMIATMNGCISGNVFSYNYFTAPYHKSWASAGAAFYPHGAHPIMNLYEGNYADSKFVNDWVWGSTSHITLFGNRFRNEDGFTNNNNVIDLMYHAQYFNIIGNVLGESDRETVYEFEGVEEDQTIKSIYKLGYVSTGDSGAAGNDPRVKATLIRHGNWDGVNNDTLWDANNSDHLLPSSLYLDSKPSWFGNLAWPPIIPDLNPMTGIIPAKARYEGQSYPYESSSDAIPPQSPTQLQVR